MTAILLVVVDCLRADRAFAQAQVAPDGFVGRLVRRGRSFTGAVTVTPTTTPAFASMLTGCYPFEHGVRGLAGYARPDEVATIAGTLRAAGYRCEAEVTGPLQPSLRLFDEFDAVDHLAGRDASVHGPRGDAIAARVRRLRATGEPWFALVHLWDLHEPRVVGPDAHAPGVGRSIYDRALATLDGQLARILPDELLDGVTVLLVGDHGENLRLEPRGTIGNGVAGLLWHPRSRRVVQGVAKRVIAHGARSSSKRLLRTAPRALITHGHHLFEPLLRVPYVLAGEGIAPSASGALVTHVDLAPTLAELAGEWFPGGLGAAPLPLDGDGDPERRVVLETAWVTSLPGVRQIGIRTPGLKYIELADGSAPALFDLRGDPAERRNVVRSRPEVAAGLARELHELLGGERLGASMERGDVALVEARLRDLGYFD